MKSWGCNVLHIYDYFCVHKRGIRFNFAVLCRHILSQIIARTFVHYGGPLRNIQHLYLYGSVTRLQGCMFNILVYVGVKKEPT